MAEYTYVCYVREGQKKQKRHCMTARHQSRARAQKEKSNHKRVRMEARRVSNEDQMILDNDQNQIAAVVDDMEEPTLENFQNGEDQPSENGSDKPDVERKGIPDNIFAKEEHYDNEAELNCVDKQTKGFVSSINRRYKIHKSLDKKKKIFT
jgi:hypothetical protein